MSRNKVESAHLTLVTQTKKIIIIRNLSPISGVTKVVPTTNFKMAQTKELRILIFINRLL